MDVEQVGDDGDDRRNEEEFFCPEAWTSLNEKKNGNSIED